MLLLTTTPFEASEILDPEVSVDRKRALSESSLVLDCYKTSLVPLEAPAKRRFVRGRHAFFTPPFVMYPETAIDLSQSLAQLSISGDVPASGEEKGDT